MNARTRKSEIGRLCLLAIAQFTAFSSCAATNGVSSSDALTLLPPHPELLPSIWEQHGVWLLPTAILLLALLAAAIWWWCRPRPPVQVPIEIQTRQALEILRRQTEDGQTLSQVSRLLRRYVVVAFELPPDELTTSEFCRVLRTRENIGVELAEALAGFLCRCDELKFAPAQPSPPFGAAECALQLVELGETRRAHWRQPTGADAGARPQPNP